MQKLKQFSLNVVSQCKLYKKAAIKQIEFLEDMRGGVTEVADHDLIDVAHDTVEDMIIQLNKLVGNAEYLKTITRFDDFE